MTKLFRTIAGALALALISAVASAQTNPGTSPLSIVKGGTGASTASAARSNLGLAIGSAVQAWDADLDALAALSGTSTIYYRSGANTWSAVTIGGFLSFSAGTLNVGDAELTALAGLTSAADKCAYFTGSGTAALTDCPSFGRSLMNTASASAARTALVLVPGTDVQAYDAELAALAGLTSAADKLPYFTGSGSAALADLSSAMRTWFTTSSSANLRGVLSDETGTGAAVFGTAPTIDGLFNISGAMKLSTESAPAQITSDQNDYNPSSVNCATSSTLIVTTDASRTITGLAGPVAGCEMTIINGGTNDLVLANESASSTAANRFGFGADVTLTTKQACKIRYDGTNTRWRALGCQGSGGGGGSVTTTYPLNGTSALTWIGPTHAGRLDYSSSISIKFNPYDGDIVRIQGAVYQIPSSGVDCGNPSGGVFLNGIGSSSLSTSTTYYVYVFNNSGTLACDFSTTAYALDTTSGNIGTYIKSGVASRSLIGMVRIAGSVAYTDSVTQRFVISWFNKKPIKGENNFTTTRTTTQSCGGPPATYAEVNSEIRVEFLAWANVSITSNASGSFFITTSGTVLSAIGYDGTTATEAFNVMTGTSAQPLGMTANGTLSEGYHYATILGCVSANTGNWYVYSNTAGQRTALKVRIMGAAPIVYDNDNDSRLLNAAA